MDNIPWKDGLSVAVIGDLLLDVYQYGLVERISPEAPVPIFKGEDGPLCRPGGAGNVACNLSQLGAKPTIFGICGRDDSGETLLKLLREVGVETQVLQKDSCITPQKTRFLVKNQQIFRWDLEKPLLWSLEEQDSLMERLEDGVWDVCLLSDYGKGTLPAELVVRILTWCRKKKILSLVDPKAKNFRPYVGCDWITPNRQEAVLALGYDPENNEILAEKLREKYQLSHVLVTLGAEGMILAHSKGLLWEKSHAKAVFDVTGAGDVVASVLALVLTSGASHETCLKIASLAGGLAVEKLGAQPISVAELSQSLGHADLDKVCSLKSLLKNLESRRGKEPIVFTNGCFDLFHSGHLQSLLMAKKRGFLVVGVNSDESLKELKGNHRPIIPLQERLALLKALSCVDQIIVFQELTPENLIQSIRPDVLLKGEDYRNQEIAGSEFVKSYGGIVDFLPLMKGLSTSSLIEKIKNI